MEALAKWQQYLLNIMEPFKIWTDHKNLKYFWEPHKLNSWQARWYLKLQDYDFTLWHISGKTNTKVDNKDVQLLKEELWTSRMTVEVIMLRRMAITDDLEIMKEIKRNNTKE